jgi:hypothetical protein
LTNIARPQDATNVRLLGFAEFGFSFSATETSQKHLANFTSIISPHHIGLFGEL